MVLTVREMATLCVFHSGTLSATQSIVRLAATDVDAANANRAELLSLTEKLSGLKEGDVVSLAFEPET